MNVLVAVYPRPTVDIVRVLILAMLIGMRASQMAWWLSPSASAGDVSSISWVGNPLKREIATHSSILAWEIPWTEEPGRLQSMGSQRVKHNLVTKQGFPHSSVGKESTCYAGDPGSISGSGRSAGEGIGYPFQCS